MKAPPYTQAIAIGVEVLLVIKNTGVATVTEVQKQAMPSLTRRTVQRYLKALCENGLVYTVGDGAYGRRYFLTDKSKELFGMKNDK